MTKILDVPAPPYPYPQPLAREAKSAHLNAVNALQRRINWWNGLVFFPGLVSVIISVGWGRRKHPEPGDRSLWDTHPTLALNMLVVGLILLIIGAVAMVPLVRRLYGHVRLLRSYGEGRLVSRY